MLDLKAHQFSHLMLLIAAAAAVRGFSVHAHAAHLLTQTIQAAATLSPEGVPVVPYSLYLLFFLLFFNSSQTHARHTTVPLNHLMHIRAHAACCLTHPTQEAAVLSPEGVLVVLDFIYLFSFFLLFLNISQPTLGMLQSHRTTSFHPAYTRETQKHHQTSLTWNILGISLASAL